MAPGWTPAPTPIETGEFVAVRGVDQWITIRGRDLANPPLLILTGPGAALSRLAPFFAPWEAHWTLVQWDQPGAGATFAKNGETPLSLDRLADDAAAVAEIACGRLGGRRLAVLGVSGGSILALKLAKARPDLVAASVGTGQIVHWARQAARGWRLALDGARARRDAAALAALEAAGPPPYAGIEAEMAAAPYVNAMTPAELAGLAEMTAEESAAVAAPPAGASWAPADLPLPDQRARGFAGYVALRAEIAAFDAWELATHFDVPMVFLQGSDDHYTPTPEVAEYAAAITAPSVRLETIAGGGHSALFLRHAFLAALKAHVRPLLAPP
jgi:pimeloyl-ACP methyl ester carboxylesterase